MLRSRFTRVTHCSRSDSVCLCRRLNCVSINLCGVNAPSKPPLPHPLYFNLILLWDVLLFLVYFHICFNFLFCVLPESNDPMRLSVRTFDSTPFLHKAKIAFDCLIRIWCGCFLWNPILTNGCVLELIHLVCHLLGGLSL